MSPRASSPGWSRGRASMSAIVIAANAGGLSARTDARIRPGIAVGVTTTLMRTPDAVTYTPDAFLIGVPERFPAATYRVHVEPYLAYGWRRIQLTLHPAGLRVPVGDDLPEDDGEVIVPVAQLDLYAKVFDRGPWHAGAGVESAPGGYVVGTYEASPRDAGTVTLRGVFGGRDGSKAMPRYNTQLQLQLSYVRIVGRFDIAGFVGVSEHVGGGDGSLLWTELGQGARETTYTRAVYAGVGVTAW